MNAKDTLERTALKAIQGLLLGADVGKIEAPLRRGTCIVERCAQLIEASCRSCRGSDCQRCTITAELRTAEDRINAERDVELADNAGLDELIDKIVENLCTEHVAWGSELVGQWYGRKSFLPTAALVDDELHKS